MKRACAFLCLYLLTLDFATPLLAQEPEPDTTPPQFVTVLPQDGSVVSAAGVTLEGDVSGADAVTVDGQPANLVGGHFVAGPYTLGEGARTWSLRATDAAGNEATRTHRIVRDSTPPVLTVSQPQPGAVRGASPVAVVGTVQDAHAVTVTVNGTAATLTGTTWVVPNAPLAEGETLLSVEARDAAGNVTSATRTVVLDTLPPTVAITDPAPGTVVPGASIAVSGSVSDPHLDRLEVNGVRATVANGTWTATVPLSEGNNDLVARAWDTLGWNAADTVSLLRDSQAPAIQIGQPEEGSWWRTATVAVSGTVEEEAGLTVTVNGGAATLTGGSFAAASVALTEGENRLVARVVDRLGNQGAHTRIVYRDTVAPRFVASAPAGGALALPLEASLALTFSEELRTPLAAGSWRLETAAGQPVAATATVSGETVTFDPQSLLPSRTGLRLVLTAGLVDRAGNALAEPPTLTFTTADREAPPPPVLSAPPAGFVCGPRLALSGTAEADSVVEVTGGAGVATTGAAENGAFSLTVDLRPETINRLEIVARDRDGNRSAPLAVEVVHDCTAPRVSGAALSGNVFTVTFSERIDAASLAGALQVATAAGPLSGTVAQTAGGTAATFTPAASLPAEPLRLTVSPAVHDLAGNALAYPYSQLFGTDATETPSFLAGRVIDNETGRPLAGAVVAIVASNGTATPEPQPEQTTAADGRFRLPAAQGTHLLLTARRGYTPSLRFTSVATNAGADVFDPRLTPAAAAVTIPAAGGTFPGKDGLSLTIPAGALAAPASVAVTALEEQGLPALLPYGWSPRGAAWVDLGGVELANPATLALPVDAPNGTTLALVQLNLANLQWKVVEVTQIAAGKVSIPVDAEGGWAAVEADTGATAPPAPVAGAVLGSAVAASSEALTAAALAFDPETILASQRSVGTVTYTVTAGSELPSGIPLSLVIREELTLLDGSVRRPGTFEADLVAYRAPSGGGGGLRSRFGLRPSIEAQSTPLRLGSEAVAIHRYADETVRGNVLGPQGGSVVSTEGDQVTVPAGGLLEPTAVTLTRRAQADLPRPVPAGTSFLGLLELDLSGRTLSAPAQLTLDLGAAPGAGDRGLLFQSVDLGNGALWRPVASLTATATGWTTTAVDPEDLPWPGVREGAVYLFAKLTAPVGLVRGTVFDVDGSPLAGAVISSASLGWLQISLGGALNGRYVLPAPEGAHNLLAENRATGNLATATVTLPSIGDPAPRIDRDLFLHVAGPLVIGTTPVNGATNVLTGIEPTITFSEPVDPATLAAGILLYDGPTAVPFGLQVQGTLVRVKPRVTLRPGATHELRVNTAVRDLQGNRLEQAVTSTFVTLTPQLGNQFDLTRIHLLEPVGGIARVVARPGAVPANSTVIVRRTTGSASTITGTAGQDGSFELSIPATLADTILLEVLREQQNSVVIELTPFLTADGRAAYVDEGVPATFTTLDGITVKIEAGTFLEPAVVRVVPRTLDSLQVPTPAGLPKVYAFDLDFGGVQAQKPLQISVPTPAGVTGNNFLLSRIYRVLGQDYWMLYDLMRRDGGRITTELLPDEVAALVGPRAAARLASLAPELPSGPGEPNLVTAPGRGEGKKYVPGAVNAGTYMISENVMAVDFVSLPVTTLYAFYKQPDLEGWALVIDDLITRLLSFDLVLIPVPSGTTFLLRGYELLTGHKFFEKTFDPPTPGQITVFKPDVFGDKTPPWPVSGSPVRFFSLVPNEATSEDLDRGIHLEVQAGSGTSGSLQVTGSAGAAQKNVEVRILGLDDSKSFVARSSATDGSFGVGGPVTFGNRYLLVIGAAVTAGDSLEIGFSEGLAQDFPGIDVLDSQGRSVRPRREPVRTSETVRITPAYGWRAGETYKLRLGKELADNAGNAWDRQLDVELRVDASQELDTFELPAVRDMVRVGSLLFVAAEDQGLVVLDASDPAHLQNAVPGSTNITFPFPLADPVMGLATDLHGRVYVVGGGLKGFGQLKIFDPLAFDPQAISQSPNDPAVRYAAFKGSTLLSDPMGTTSGTTLPEGRPYEIAVLSNDESVRWRFGIDSPPEGIVVTPSGPIQGETTVTIGGNDGKPGHPVTVRNLTRGRWNRIDAFALGLFSLPLKVAPGDEIEIRRNQSTIAYVMTRGVGIQVVDVDGFYNEDHDSQQSDVVGTYTGYEDDTLALCGQPVSDISAALIGVGTLFDPKDPAHPVTLAGLVGLRGLALFDSDPDDVGDVSFFNEMCMELGGSAQVSSLEIVEDYPFDTNGNGSFDPTEYRDYILVAHRTQGVLVVDAQNRDELRLVGWIKLPGGQASHISVDRDRRRLYVSAFAGGVYVLDFDRPPTTLVIDVNGDAVDDRILETIPVPQNVNVNAPVFLLPELGLAFTGGAGRGVTSLAVGGPRLTLIAQNRGPQPPPEGKGWREIRSLAPLGVPTAPESPAAGAPEISASFRVFATLPGVTGNEVRLDVTSVGPGGLPILGAGDPAAMPDLPKVSLAGAEEGIRLHRLADHPWEEGYQQYLSEEVVAVADLRASRMYQRTPAENVFTLCRRCRAEDLGIPADAREILSGHQIAVRLSEALRASLAATYSGDRLTAAEVLLPSIPWDLSPTIQQEPASNPSLGGGEVVPGTLLHSGEMTLTATDLFLKGAGIDFAFTRTYRSQAIGSGPLGPGWDHAYNLRVRELPDGNLDFFDGRGRREVFLRLPGDRYGSPTGRFASMHRTAAGWVMIDREHNMLRFDRFGRLISMANFAKSSRDTGTELELTYDLKSRLTRVRAHGRELLLSYDESGRLLHVRDFAGRQVGYEYDSAGRLVKATSPKVTIGQSKFSNGLTTTYTYAAPAGPLAAWLHSRDNLITVTDPRGNRWLEITYTDADGDGHAQEVTNQKFGLSSATLSYSFGARQTQVLDRRLHTWTYQHDADGHPVLVKDPLQNTKTFEYSAGGVLTRTTLPLGRQIVNELQPNPDDDPRARMNLSRSRVIADSRGPNGSAPELVNEFLQYDGRTNTPSRVRDPRSLLRHARLNDQGLPEEVVEAATTEDEGRTTTEYNAIGLPTRIVNPNGHVTRLDYFEGAPLKGFLRQVTVDPDGLALKTTYEWDQYGNPSAVIDPRGVRHEYVYNEVGWLVEEHEGVYGSDGAPLVRRYLYDANGNVQEVRTAAGDDGESFTRTQYDYGTLNELLEVRNEVTPGAGDFAITRYGYDLGLNRNHEEGPNGQVTDWTYDERNLPKTIKRGVGESYESTETFEYDAEGQVTVRTDGEEKVWTTVYDGYGRVSQEIDPLSNVRTVAYDNDNNPTSVRQYDAEQHLQAKKETGYDARNRVETERHYLWDPQDESSEPRPLTRSFEYDPASNLKVARDEKGAETLSFYDAAERQVAVQDALGNRTDLTLDGQGNAIRTSVLQRLPGAGSFLSETIRTFSPLGQAVQETDPTGRTTQWIRDVRGNVRLLVDGGGLTTESLYDGLDRLVRVTLPDGTSEEFGYDASSRLINYRDSLAQVTQLSYDERDRLLQLQYPDQTLEKYSYDARDLRIGWERPSGTKIEESYDDAGRLIQREVVQAEEIEGPTLETFSYDALGRVTRATSGDVITERHYDSLSQLLSETNAGRTVTHAYDDAGHRTEIHYPSGRVVEIQPDLLGRPATIAAKPTSGAAVPKVTYGYRGSDLVATKALGTAVSGTLQYDTAGLLLQAAFTNTAGQLIFQETLSWSSRGLKAAQARGDLNNAALHFTYDGAGHLTEARRRSGTDQTAPVSRTFQNLPDVFGFTYDKAHNLLAKVEERLCENEQVLLPLEASGRNRPAQVGGTALEWSTNGNLETKGDLSFHYDWKDRLTRVTRAGLEVARYTYDAFNRRVAKDVASEHLETVWDGWQPIEEYRGTQLNSRRIYGVGLDEIVSLEIDFDHDGTLTEYLPYYDSTGNLVAVTDTQGKVVERYEYSPYGERWVFVDSTAPSLEQVRVKGNEVWIELSEEVLLQPLVDAISAGTLKLAKLATDEPLPIAITQPVGPGVSGARRLVIKLTSPEEDWPEAGTPLRVTLPAAALRDLFGNVASDGAVETFAWQSGDSVLEDTVAPRVLRVCINGGHLEIELSEEPRMADVASAIQVNGAPIEWNLAGGGYLLVSAAVLEPGSFTLTIGTQPLDLAGLGLAESFTRSFTLATGETRKPIFLRSLPGFLPTSAIGNLFGFHGQSIDPETGLLYVRNRYYDPELGRFITTDPMGHEDGPNLYQYALNNPVNNSDPTGEIVETAWDLVSLGVGLVSLGYNLKKGNYGAALLDAFGVVLDGIAVVVPLLPGGAGALIKASRAAGLLGKLEYIDRGINTAQGLIQAYDELSQEHYGWGAFHLGMSALGVKGLVDSPFKVEIRGLGSNIGNASIVSKSTRASSPQVAPTAPARNVHLADLPIHERFDRFYVRASELLEDSNIVRRHPLDKRQLLGSPDVGHGGVQNLSTEDLLRFGGPQGNDPISGFRAFQAGDVAPFAGSRIHIEGGHHRLSEIARRTKAGEIGLDVLIEFAVGK